MPLLMKRRAFSVQQPAIEHADILALLFSTVLKIKVHGKKIKKNSKTKKTKKLGQKQLHLYMLRPQENAQWESGPQDR